MRTAGLDNPVTQNSMKIVVCVFWLFYLKFYPPDEWRIVNVGRFGSEKYRKRLMFREDVSKGKRSLYRIFLTYFYSQILPLFPVSQKLQIPYSTLFTQALNQGLVNK